jgi:hypothetical protein
MNQVTAYVLQLRGLSISEKAVALVLAGHASADGSNSYPSMTTVAQEAGLGYRQTASVIAHRLEARGIVEATSERTGGRAKPTVYRFPEAPQFKFGKCNSPVAVSQPESATLTDGKCNSGVLKCNPGAPKVQSPSCTNSSNRKENRKENSAAPFSFSKTEKRGQDNSPENGNSERSREFYVWFVGRFPELGLSKKQRFDVTQTIESSDYDLPELKRAVHNLTRDFNLTDSYEKSQARESISANLREGCEVARRELRKEAADQERKNAEQIRLARGAAEDRARLAAERAKEIVEDVLVWD